MLLQRPLSLVLCIWTGIFLLASAKFKFISSDYQMAKYVTSKECIFICFSNGTIQNTIPTNIWHCTWLHAAVPSHRKPLSQNPRCVVLPLMLLPEAILIFTMGQLWTRVSLTPPKKKDYKESWCKRLCLIYPYILVLY